MERLIESGAVDLYTVMKRVSRWSRTCRDAWQFGDKAVAMPSEKGVGINCFGLFTRLNKSWTATSEKAIDAAFVVEQLERLRVFALETNRRGFK